MHVGYACYCTLGKQVLHAKIKPSNSNKLNDLLNRYTQVTMGTPAVTDQTSVPATSCSEEFIVVVTPRKDYCLKREELNLISPIQETCQFTSAEHVF